MSFLARAGGRYKIKAAPPPFSSSGLNEVVDLILGKTDYMDLYMGPEYDSEWEDEKGDEVYKTAEKEREAREEWANDMRVESEEYDPTTQTYFENPRRLNKPTLIRFSNYDPDEWRGCDARDLGLTVHYSCRPGSLSFAFESRRLKKSEYQALKSKYGKRVFEVKVPEALIVYHDADGEDQVIFDLDDIISVREILE